MKFSIHFRAYTGRSTLEMDIGADFDNALYGVKLGAAVKVAYRSGAVLRGAVLRDAVLRGADLRDADLRYAVLRGAVLRYAVLRGADLRYADLRGADLRYADLRGVPVIPHIDATILAAITVGGTLDMGAWHKCKTTHCRGGWAITLAGEAGAKLESMHGAAGAGVLIYAASRPGQRIPNFYASNAEAMEDMIAAAAADPLPAE